MINHKRMQEVERDTDNPMNFLEGLVEHSGITDRTFVQAYCIWKYKYELGIKEQRDPEWEYASDKWCADGLAESFAEVYDARCNIHTIYDRTKAGLVTKLE